MMQNLNEEQAKKLSQLVAKCWSDQSFKQGLLADPAGTLKAQGLEVPEGVTVNAVENTDKLFYLVIPAKPKDLSIEDLDKIAAGACRCLCEPGDRLLRQSDVPNNMLGPLQKIAQSDVPDNML